MVALTGSVGENGKNARPYVALVHFMLAMARDSRGLPYYDPPYIGSYDARTKLAVAAFLGGDCSSDGQILGSQFRSGKQPAGGCIRFCAMLCVYDGAQDIHVVGTPHP